MKITEFLVDINSDCFRYHLMLNCWRENPKERPTFAELREHLEKYLENVSAYVTIKNMRQEKDSNEDYST